MNFILAYGGPTRTMSRVILLVTLISIPLGLNAETADELPIGRLLVRRIDGGGNPPVEVWHPRVTSIVCTDGRNFAPLEFPMGKDPCG